MVSHVANIVQSSYKFHYFIAPKKKHRTPKVIFSEFVSFLHLVASSPDNKSKVEKILETKSVEPNSNIEQNIDQRNVDVAQRNSSLSSSSSPSLTQPAAQINGLISSEYPFDFKIFVCHIFVWDFRRHGFISLDVKQQIPLENKMYCVSLNSHATASN